MASNVEKISVALTPEMVVGIQKAVEAGEYASVSEAVRDSVRAWQEKREVIAELKAAIAEGLNSGPAIEISIDEILALAHKAGN